MSLTLRVARQYLQYPTPVVRDMAILSFKAILLYIGYLNRWRPLYLIVIELYSLNVHTIILVQRTAPITRCVYVCCRWTVMYCMSFPCWCLALLIKAKIAFSSFNLFLWLTPRIPFSTKYKLASCKRVSIVRLLFFTTIELVLIFYSTICCYLRW